MKCFHIKVLNPARDVPGANPTVYTEIIYADYVTFPNGMLVFKRMSGTYPEIVKIYAPGYWLKVEHLEDGPRE